MPKSPNELRSYVFGIICGIGIVIGAFMFVSWTADIKWLPVRADKPLYCPRTP